MNETREIRLIRLTLENFKACVSRTFDFDGRNVTIYGANSTGKTTIYSALTWLLFDKIADNDGTVQSNPDVKPNGADGEILNHDAVTTVEAVFSVNGETITLKRSFFEKWEKKRGSDTAIMSGHTSEYFWDDVPIQLNEYKARMEENLCREDLFWTLSNIHWFCLGMDWKKRRDLLTEVCDLPDDRAIMDANPEQFFGLADSMGSKTMPDYRAWIDAQMKKLNGAQKTYPARLDEVRKTIVKYGAVNFDSLRTLRETVEIQLQTRTDELSRLNNGTLLASKRNELDSLRNQMRDLDLRNTQHRQSQSVPAADRRPAIERELAQLQKTLTKSEQQADVEQRMAESINDRISALRADWKAAETETFTAQICPTCSQRLPPAAQVMAELQFNETKKRNKSEIEQSAKREKENLTACETRKSAALETVQETKDRISLLKSELAACTVPETPVITNLPGYEADMTLYRQKIAALETEIAGLEQQDAASRERINREIARLRQEKLSLDDQIATERVLTDAQAREKELREEAQKAADELNALDGQRTLCEEFMRFKVRYIDNSVSGRFRTVRFRLFQPQVNGGLKDCCDVYVGGGRLGHGLNTGAEYNAGIDVIDVLSKHYGVRPPLFIDGAESVSNPLPIDTQVINLTVSKEDRILRMEADT